MDMRTAPEIKANKADFTDSARNQIAHADFFVMAVEDLTDLVDEYRDLLTAAEMKTCFKRAQSAA